MVVRHRAVSVVAVPARGLRGGFGGPGPNGSSTAGQVAAYVQQFAATTVGGATVYDLTTPISQ